MHGVLRVRCVLAALAAATLLTAQQRRPLAGLVLDEIGAPLAGARVLLAGETSPAWTPATDLVTAVADDDGRFRAMVLECVEYDAWAVGGGRADGSWLASLPTNGVVPGPRLELRTMVLRERRLRVHGLRPWADLAPFEARLWLVASGHVVAVPVDQGGNAVVPREWPAGDALVEIRDRAGQALVVDKVDVGEWTVSIPAPVAIDVQVEDAAGRPLAGVTVERRFRAGARLQPLGHRARRMQAVLGATGPDGRLRARVAAGDGAGSPSALAHLQLRASAPGWADAFATTLRGTLFSAAGSERTVDGVRLLPFAMREAREITGEVLLAPGRPLQGCSLRIGTREILHGDGVGLHMDDAHDARTGADGRFSLDRLGQGAECIELRLGVEALAAAVGDQRRTRAFPPGQPFVAAALAAEPPHLRVDLSRLGRLSLQVVDERDGPASGALVVLQSERGDATYIGEGDPRFRLDPAGRATVLLERGPWFLVATDGERGAWRSIVVGENEDELRLQIRPWPRLRGLVRDAADRPVAGARFEPRSYGPGSRRLDYLHVLLLQRWLPQTVSDADGGFGLPFLPGTRVEYTVRMAAGDRRSAEFVLAAQDEPLVVTLR